MENQVWFGEKIRDMYRFFQFNNVCIYSQPKITEQKKRWLNEPDVNHCKSWLVFASLKTTAKRFWSTLCEASRTIKMSLVRVKVKRLQKLHTNHRWWIIGWFSRRNSANSRSIVNETNFQSATSSTVETSRTIVISFVSQYSLSWQTNEVIGLTNRLKCLTDCVKWIIKVLSIACSKKRAMKNRNWMSFDWLYSLENGNFRGVKFCHVNYRLN